MGKTKTLVLGATTDPTRFAYKAARSLLSNKEEVLLVGRREGELNGLKIHTGEPSLEGVHTVTLYIGTKNLPPFFDYILSLKPERIIFNPGTYHPELEKRALENGIEVLNACTLVMLATGEY